MQTSELGVEEGPLDFDARNAEIVAKGSHTSPEG
jgi:hypothetical protein